MKLLRGFLLGAAGVFAVVPGVSSLQKGLLAPPGLELLFSAFSVASGTLALIVFYLLRGELRVAPMNRLIVCSVACLVVSLGFAMAYLDFYHNCIIQYDDISPMTPKPGEPAANNVHKRVAYLPRWPSGFLGEEIDKRGRAEVVDVYREDFPRMIAMNPARIWWTSVAFLIVHVGIYSALTIAFAILGFGLKAPTANTHAT